MSNRPDLFVHTINSMDFGVTAEDLSTELAELLQAVRDTNKKGTLTLKLTVKPESVATGQVSITPDISSTPPQLPRDKAMMFMTPDNNLQREDPRQRTMEFEAVAGGKTNEYESADKPADPKFQQA